MPEGEAPAREPRVVFDAKMVAFIYGLLILLYFVGDKAFHLVKYLSDKEAQLAADRKVMEQVQASDSAQTKILAAQDQLLQLARRDLDAQRLDFENEKKNNWTALQDTKARMDRIEGRIETRLADPKPAVTPPTKPATVQ